MTQHVNLCDDNIGQTSRIELTGQAATQDLCSKFFSMRSPLSFAKRDIIFTIDCSYARIKPPPVEMTILAALSIIKFCGQLLRPLGGFIFAF